MKKDLRGKYRGVWCVGEGKKWVNGEKTDRDALVFVTLKKLKKENIEESQLIPKEIDGVETDIWESDIPEALLDNPEDRQKSVRPLQGGISVGCAFSTAGTLQIVARYNDKPALFSNAHVIAPHWSGAKIGHPVIQPGWVDGVFEEIGTLVDYEEIDFREGENIIDFAIAELKEGVDYKENFIIGHGEIKPEIRRAKSGDLMKKTGRTSGPNEAEVLLVNATALVRIGGVVTEWEDQIMFDNRNAFVRAGDSGSMLLFEDNAIGGVVYAGSEKVGIGNQFVNVKKRFPGISFTSEEEDATEGWIAAGGAWSNGEEVTTPVGLRLRKEPYGEYIKTLSQGTKIQLLGELPQWKGGYYWLNVRV